MNKNLLPLIAIATYIILIHKVFFVNAMCLHRFFFTELSLFFRNSKFSLNTYMPKLGSCSGRRCFVTVI